ncbi:MAG: PKD domain-containing protein [Thermoplasmata archaeon]|nr:MAG: PKD domain-containing protein [Thermoplasmata archaeon]
MKSNTAKLNKKLNMIILLIIVVIIVMAIAFSGAIDFAKSPEASLLKARISTNATQAYVNDDILFDASNSTGENLDYMWDFGGGYTQKGISVSHSFPISNYYNVYLIVTNPDGERNIDMINITIYNRNHQEEVSGSLLGGSQRRVQSSDYIFCDVYPGITKPTVYGNLSGTTEMAIIDVYFRAADNYNIETLYLVGENLEYSYVIEDVEVEEEADCYLEIYCVRGYLTDYKLLLNVVY